MKFHLRWAVTALIVGALGASTVSNAASVSGQGTWETTLQERDLDGNLSTFEAYYDTSLNITWLANANYAGTTMDWSSANAWAASLNPYGSGISGWRLPIINDVGTDGLYLGGGLYTNIYGYSITAHSEISHMFYITLGDKAYCTSSGSCPQAGWGLTNTGPFSNVRAGVYWSATEFAGDADIAWSFDTYDGSRDYKLKSGVFSAWAVHSGDVGAYAVPVPAAVWLFGSGLLGLVGMARRKKEVA